LQRDLNALSLVPRVSLRDGRAKVQRGEDLELGYSRKEGSRTYRVSGYRERVSNAALTIVAPGGVYIGGDILPDLFSSSSVFDAGNYQTLGYTASVTQNLGDNFKVTAMYGSVGVLVPQSDHLSTDNPEELRSLIQASRRNAVTARGSGTVPKIGTHFIASYQWMDQSAITPAHMYSTQSIRPEPGLNIYVRQPIPTFFSLPWRPGISADVIRGRTPPAAGADPAQFPRRLELYLLSHFCLLFPQLLAGRVFEGRRMSVYWPQAGCQNENPGYHFYGPGEFDTCRSIASTVGLPTCPTDVTTCTRLRSRYSPNCRRRKTFEPVVHRCMIRASSVVAPPTPYPEPFNSTRRSKASRYSCPPAFSSTTTSGIWRRRSIPTLALKFAMA
jgi:hypothetical protein